MRSAGTPNAVTASPVAARQAAPSSAGLATTRMPFPPPPPAGLSSTG